MGFYDTFISMIYLLFLWWTLFSLLPMFVNGIKLQKRGNCQVLMWIWKLSKMTLRIILWILTNQTIRDMCTPMFIAALFIIARTWKQPRCPSADEWIKKLWYIYTMEYYAAIKKNSFESILMRWMKLEPIIQSKVSQKDKDHYNILTHIYGI